MLHKLKKFKADQDSLEILWMLIMILTLVTTRWTDNSTLSLVLKMMSLIPVLLSLLIGSLNRVKKII